VFRDEYNQQRPHEALDMRTPVSCYTTSPRPYPSRIPEFEYGSGLIVRRVQDRGEIRWQGRKVFVSKVLEGEPLGVEIVDDRCCRLWLGRTPIANMGPHSGQVCKLTIESTPWK
jgi:hypothetical protein